MANLNQAIIDYMLQCPQISENALYFNFGEAADNNKQIITQGNDRAINKPYIDGSVLKQYTFTLFDFRSIAALAVPKSYGYVSENVEEILDVQAIIDWITEQERLKNYPNFGENCFVQKIRAITDNPNLNGIDMSVSPAIARYSISVQVEYIDTSNRIWNNR